MVLRSRKRLRFPTRLRPAALLALGAVTLAGCGDIESDPAGVADALRSLASAPPVPLGITPDAKRILLKTSGDTTFKLTVVERSSGQTVAEQTFHDSPLAGSLRGDGEAFAYMVDQGGNQQYVPMMVEVGARGTRGLGAPATSIPGPLQWSPDGTRLAYLHAGKATPARRLLVSSTEPSGARWRTIFPDVAPRTGFAWSADSRSVAAVRRSSRGVISVASLDGPVREYPVARGAEIRELAWMPGDRVLATVRGPGRPFLGIVEVDLTTGRVRSLVNGPWDVAEPQIVHGGASWAFHANIDSESTPLVCAAGSAACRLLGLPAGTSRILGSVPGTDTVLVSHRGRSTPPRVIPIALHESPRTPANPPGDARAESTPPAERMDLRPGDGPRVPVYVWRAARPRGGVRAAVIRVHGGPAVQADRAWDRTTEYLLRNGIDVLQLNYRGSTGYGAPFERARGGDCARVRDLAAAVTLARDELGVPGERIILYGHSYGALLVAKAGRALPAPIGGVVLVSMTADADPASCGSGDDSLRPKRILAYHGANDYGLSPSQARRGVASLVGGGMLQRRRVHWRVFDREGHTFHRNATWARVYADIIAVLDRAS